MKRKIFLWLNLVLVGQLSSAQNFKLMRYDEDYSFLKDSARNFYNRIKFIPLNDKGNIYLSFGRGIRQEVDLAQNEGWGAAKTGTDLFSLQRYELHADLHLGRTLRVFGQFRSGLEFGRKTGPRPIDEDQLNVQNLFVDFIPYQERNNSLTIRVGRQEIQYGSGRLLDVREGPNLRQYFDGVKAAYTSSKWRIDGFVLANAGIKFGVFDNPPGDKANLWGIYNTWLTSRTNGFDLYYLGINRNQARFDEGAAEELRHTLGARTWRSGPGLLYNLEAGYQFGKFGNSSIRAWGGSAEIGYRYENISGKPALKLRADLISGDKNKDDGKLGTFNPLYPNGGYFGMNPQAGPVNILSVHPNFSWNPAQRINLSVEVVFYWRQSLQDGVYRPDASLNLPSSGSTERYIGTAYIGTASVAIRKTLSLNLGAQFFKTGSFIDNVIPQHKDGIFISSLLSYKFRTPDEQT